MHTFLDAKTMAKSLRAALSERHMDITHSDSLELVARQFGLHDWNTLSARIESASSSLSLPAGWIVAGVNPELYRLGIDPEMRATIRIERISGTSESGDNKFGTLMQSIDAREFTGKSLSLGADLMSRGAGKGSLWVRVDPVGGGRHLQFDNMHQRTVEGPLSGDDQSRIW